MRNPFFVRTTVVALAACLAAACGNDQHGSQATPTVAPIASLTATRASSATAAPPATDTPPPSATLAAATATVPAHTATPIAPTATATDTPSPTPTASEFDVVASAPRFTIPGDTLPAQFSTFASNNNVDIVFHDGRLFLAWRAAPNHFAGPDTHMYIMSSGDDGATWAFEHDVFLATDMREPRFLEYQGALQLMFFEAGSDSGTFTPRKLWRTRRLGAAQWSDLELLTDAGEVPWDVKVHNGVAYRTSYMGDHYGSGDTSDVSVFFKQTTDGNTWTPVGGRDHVYYGGVSEVAFDFDRDGTLWAVTRNEDGDASGFGSHLCTAPADDLSAWDCPSVTDPDRYDSPKIFRHGDELYLLARRDVGGPYDGRDADLSLAERRARYLIAYSLRPKRFALYHIDRSARRVVHVMDLPGVGDTSFPSVQQTGPDTYLIANYTSPLDQPDISWLQGQTNPRGTQIYLLTLTFEPYYGAPRSPTPTWTPSPTPTPPVVEQGDRIIVDPVFADPGTPLTITWPDTATLAQLNLGDGTVVDLSTTQHDYADAPDTIFPLSGSLQIPGGLVQVDGAVARTRSRAVTPLNAFTLTEPVEPVVQQVIRGIMPQFSYALDADSFAVGPDPTGHADFGFEQVTTTALARAGDGTFTAGPAAYRLELSGVGGTRTGLYIRLSNAQWSGSLVDEQIASPIHLRAAINVLDVVDVVVILAGLDRPTAIGFVAGLFGFDAEHPPETVPFAADLAAQAP